MRAVRAFLNVQFIHASSMRGTDGTIISWVPDVSGEIGFGREAQVTTGTHIGTGMESG